jgi:hypothetical protein
MIQVNEGTSIKLLYSRKFKIHLLQNDEQLYKKELATFKELETKTTDCHQIVVPKKKLVERTGCCMFMKESPAKTDGQIKIHLNVRNACRTPEMVPATPGAVSYELVIGAPIPAY